MEGIKYPWCYLVPAALAPGEGVGMFLQDTDPVPPVLADKSQLQAVTCVGGQWADVEGADNCLFYRGNFTSYT